MRLDGSSTIFRDVTVAPVPFPLSDCTVLVAPFNDLAVPVAAPFPSAFEVVVAPVDFGAADDGELGTAAGALSLATGATVGTVLGACSVGTFGTTIAEGVAAADAACERLGGAAAGDNSSEGSERSKLEKAAGAVAGAAPCAGAECASEEACATEAACADVTLEGAAVFAAAAGGAATRAACTTGGEASPTISKSEPPGFQASDSARKLDAGDFGTSSSDDSPMFGKSSNSRMSSIAWGDREPGSGAGAAAGATGGVKATEAGPARPEAAVGAALTALGAAAAWNPLAFVLVAGFDAAAAAALAGAGGTEAVRGAAG
jgi:hypothetical protein